MTGRHAYLALCGLAVMGLTVAFGAVSGGPDDSEGAVAATSKTECNSCSARKQDLSRVRKALTRTQPRKSE